MRTKVASAQSQSEYTRQASDMSSQENARLIAARTVTAIAMLPKIANSRVSADRLVGLGVITAHTTTDKEG